MEVVRSIIKMLRYRVQAACPMPYKETYAHAFVTAQKSSVTALESRDIPLFKTTFETGLLNLCSELCNSATPN